MCLERICSVGYSRSRAYVRPFLLTKMHGLRSCRCRRPIQKLFCRAPHLRFARAEHVPLPPTYPTADRVPGMRSAGCVLCTWPVARAERMPSPPTYPKEVACRARTNLFDRVQGTQSDLAVGHIAYRPRVGHAARRSRVEHVARYNCGLHHSQAEG